MSGAYVEQRPVGPLAEVAEALWCARVEAGTDDWLVLPDGCVDVVLVAGEEPHVAGPATLPVVHHATRTHATVGVRLRPGTAAALLGVAAHELRDVRVPLADVAPRLAAPGAGEALAAGDVRTALSALAARLAVPTRRDPLVERAAATLRADPGRTVGDLTRALAISPRQLRRRFDDHVGYGPKRFARVARLQRVLALARAHPGRSLAALAAEAGYADQAHLATDARALAGRSASALLAQRAGIAMPPAEPPDP